MPIPNSDPKSPTIALAMPPTAWANSLYECSTTHKLTHFYYAFLNFPVVLTLILALNARYLKGFLGLTADRVCQHIDVFVESECGHMDQVLQGIRSTKPAAATSLIVLQANLVNTNMDAAPQEPTNKCTHHVFMTVREATGSVSSNQSRRFSVMSNCGIVYVALFYVYNPNYIRSVPIKNHSKKKSCEPTRRCMRGSLPVATVPFSTSWTTRHPMTSKLSSQRNKSRSSTHPRICIAQTQPNALSGCGKITSRRALPAYHHCS